MDIYFERESLILGLSLIVATISIHATGVVVMALGMVRIRLQLEARGLALRYMVPALIGVVTVAGLLLVILHGIEAMIWAAAYLRIGALDSPIDAMFYSIDAMSTRGASGVVLQRNWQMVGALEACDGVLLFGISTAYIFGVMQVYWPMLLPRAK